MPDEKLSGLVVVGDDAAGLCVDGVCAIPEAEAVDSDGEGSVRR